EVTAVRAGDGNAADRERRAPRVRESHSLRRTGGTHILAGERQRRGRERGPRRNSGTGQAGSLRAAAGVVSDGQGPCSCPGCGGSERYVDGALGSVRALAARRASVREVTAVRAGDGDAADRKRRTPRVREGRRLRRAGG